MVNITTITDPEIFTELQTLIGLTFGSELRPVSKIEGFTIYTSDKISRYGLQLCIKQWSNLAKEFTRDVRRGSLIFGIVEKSIFRRILSLLGQSPQMTGYVCGFYYPPTNKVYILLSTAATLFSIIVESAISYVVIHEHQHKACAISPVANELAWNKLYTHWYKFFLTALQALNVLTKDVLLDKKILPYLHALSKNELKKNMRSQISIASHIWQYVLSKYMGTNDAAYLLHKIVMRNFNIDINTLYKLYSYLYPCYKYAYEQTVKFNGIEITDSDWLTSFYYQELFAPSEIAAITSGMNISNPISVKLMQIALAK